MAFFNNTSMIQNDSRNNDLKLENVGAGITKRQNLFLETNKVHVFWRNAFSTNNRSAKASGWMFGALGINADDSGMYREARGAANLGLIPIIDNQYLLYFHFIFVFTFRHYNKTHCVNLENIIRYAKLNSAIIFHWNFSTANKCIPGERRIREFW